MTTQATAAAQPRSATNPDTDCFLASPVGYFDHSLTKMMSVPPEELAQLQLAGLKRRFSQFRGALPMLDKLADSQNIHAIDELNDVLPLLFDHATYKSYPTSLLDKHRYAQLTAWLNKLTTLDLSQVDVSACRSIDDWILTLNRETPLKIVHTSGTSGSMSFLPWSKAEWKVMGVQYAVQFFQHFGQNSPAERLPLNIEGIFPYFRSGSTAPLVHNDVVVDVIAGSEERFHTAYPGRLSADLLVLAARRRAAAAKGQLDQLKISPELAARHAEFEAQQREMPGHVAKFFDTMRTKLAGQRIFMFATNAMLYTFAQNGLKQGMRKIFSPDSTIITGGGNKGMVLPDDWLETAKEFLGVARIHVAYGMSEMTSPFALCEQGHYHCTPWMIPFILDPDTGKPLPRRGRVTGQYAFYDLLAATRWGGFVTGDEVTLDWSAACPCGQTAPYLESRIQRLSEKRADAGEEKISCAATPEAYAEALDFLNEDIA